MANTAGLMQGALADVLGGKSFDIEELGSSDPSGLFMLLTVGKDKVGFSKLDGKPWNQQFKGALEGFRRLYAAHAAEWADYDLTLILCAEVISDSDRATQNEIEVDPYFCRKFVVDLSSDLRISLQRLPFVAVFPQKLKAGAIPVTAQTFLVRHGFSSQLARSVVVPQTKGVETVIEECLNSIHGDPNWVETDDEIFVTPGEGSLGSERILLKRLEIMDFRAYRGKHVFELDGRVIILFGPNGFGKTSFFDAIDFVCTGSVARFGSGFRRDLKQVAGILRHLDPATDSPYVKLICSEGTGETTFQRYLSDSAQALINGKPKNSRRATIMRVTGMLGKPPDVRIENLVSLFRASHVFGQDYQSLTSNLKDESALSEEVVTGMLASQDYVEATNKTHRILEETRSRLSHVEQDIKTLEGQLELRFGEYSALEHTAGYVASPEALAREGASLARRLSVVLRRTIDCPGPLSKDLLLGWRALVVAEISRLTQSIESLRDAEHRLLLLPKQRIRALDVSESLSAKREELARHNATHEKLKGKLDEAITVLEFSLTRERTALAEQEGLSWLLETQGTYARLRGDVAKTEKELKDGRRRIAELDRKMQTTSDELQDARRLMSNRLSAFQQLQTSVEKLLVLEQQAMGNLSSSRDDIRKAQLSVNLIARQANEVRIEMQNTQAALSEATEQRERLAHRLQQLEKSRGELESLLGAIESHLTSSVCPVCGTPHESRDQLLSRLRDQKGIEPKEIKEARRQFQEGKLKETTLENSLADLRSSFDSLNKQLAAASEAAELLKERLEAFESEALSLDVPISTEDMVAAIRDKRRMLSDQIGSEKASISLSEETILRLDQELSRIASDKAESLLALRSQETSAVRMRDAIDQIERDALFRGISLAMIPEKIRSRLNEVQLSLSDLHTSIERQQAQRQSIELDVARSTEEKNRIEKEASELAGRLEDMTTVVRESETVLERLELGPNADRSKALADRKTTTERQLAQAEELRAYILNLEVGLDSMQASATATRIQDEISATRGNLERLQNQSAALRDWHRFFDIANLNLRSMQDTIVKEYLEAHGPLASNIQRRLRSVFGFGEIMLRPERGTIAVRVKHPSHEDLRPSDYFSESQIHTVTLSLFLSMAMTQTWSSFAPILLDDPVQHFDDLNAYSFLDLIEYLATDPAMERQFVISTCDEHVFRLMRQRFRRMGDRVIFYRFESIGKDGPKFDRLP